MVHKRVTVVRNQPGKAIRCIALGEPIVPVENYHKHHLPGFIGGKNQDLI